MGKSYRPEIDGLRAVAVLAVLAFHAGLGGAGYVGVDVFFVISGYLITALLVDEFDTTGWIDFPAFYGRRAKRILPALMVVVAAATGAGALLLSSGQQQALNTSAVASLLFVANLYFPQVVGGYFDVHSDQLPLLHLWSLSVEEQFYLAWPAILVLSLRVKRSRLAVVIAVLGVLSFALATAALDINPEFAFFQTPARFWELAAGGLVATRKRPLPAGWGDVGFLTVLLACAWRLDPFPGIGAMPAVAGAALLIASGAGIGARLLASRPMVAIGVVSYSLYLWHWPLLAMYRATTIGESDPWVRLALCAIAGVLAAASYRYVEQPIRRLPLRGKRAVIVGASCTLVLSTVCWGLVLHTRRAAVADDPLAIRASHDYPTLRCHSDFSDGPDPKCPRRPGSRIAIWGDSMAWSWAPAVQSSDPDAFVVTRDACAPLIGYLPNPPHPSERTCLEANRRNAMLVSGIAKLVLVARWTDDSDRFAALGHTLDAVAPTVGQIVLIGPTPDLRDAAPRCINKHRQADCAISRSEFQNASRPILANLRHLAAQHPNVQVFDPTESVCTRDTCPPVLAGIPIYMDSHHLTTTAVRRIGIPGVADGRRVP